MKITRKQIVNLPRHELFKLANHLRALTRDHSENMPETNLKQIRTSIETVLKRHRQVAKSFYKNMDYSGIKNPRCVPRRNNWGDYQKAMGISHTACEKIKKVHDALLKGPPVIYTRS